MKSVIIIAIAFVFLIPIPIFAPSHPEFSSVDITIIEIVNNPDEPNRKDIVTLFNPLDEAVSLWHWELVSTEDQTSHDLTFYTIPPCFEKKITLSNQLIDNGLEVLLLKDNFGKTVDHISLTQNEDNDKTTWTKDTPSCVSYPREEPLVQEEYLENGCPVDFPYLWEDELCYDLPEPEPVKMGFYENERYEFSFEVPMNWSYQEGITDESGITYEVIGFPTEFSLENAGDEANMMDLQMKLSGFSFQFESPLIAVNFENIPTSTVSTLSEENLKDYVLDKIMIENPSVKIGDSWVVSNSWGWEVYAMYNFDLDIGIGTGIPYVEEVSTYFFKDRESYAVSYGAPVVYFDEYRPVFDHVLDTLIIKSVAVPEFGSIAMLILVSSIIAVIISARKFQMVK